MKRLVAVILCLVLLVPAFACDSAFNVSKQTAEKSDAKSGLQVRKLTDSEICDEACEPVPEASVPIADAPNHGTESVKFTAPTKKTYNAFEPLNLAGMKMIYVGKDKRETDVTGSCMVSGYLSSKVGVQTVTVTYKTFTQTFSVTVSDVASLNSEKKYIEFSPNMTVGDAVTKIDSLVTNAFTAQIYDGNTVVSDSQALVKTGMTAKKGSVSLDIIVLGDADKDGLAGMSDVRRAFDAMLGNSDVSSTEKQALERAAGITVSSSSDFNILDILKMMNACVYVMPDNPDMESLYREAVQYYSAGEYESAVQIFANLGAYKDSWIEDYTAQLPSYSDNKGSLVIAAYSWTGTYRTTIQGTPLFTKTFTDFADNSTVYSPIGHRKITNGTFLFLLKNGTNGVGVWSKAQRSTADQLRTKYEVSVYSGGSVINNLAPLMSFGIRTITVEKKTGSIAVKPADYTRDGWLLPGVPSYDYGTLSTGLYNCGQGAFIPTAYSHNNDTWMQCITETNSTEYGLFVQKLASAGFEREFHNEICGNIYDIYTKTGKRIYCYYTKSDGVARVIDDKSSDNINDFAYSYSKKAGETTEIYQIGLVMPPKTIDSWTDGSWVGCGMSYVIKLADNRLVMIDGGEYMQYDNNYCEDLFDFFKDITGVANNEKITFASWYVSHGHNDHNSGFAYFMEKYHEYLNVERVMFNMPDFESLPIGYDGDYEYAKKGYTTLYHYWPNLKQLQIHTGEKFTLGDASFEIIFTHEDLVNAKDCASKCLQFNDSSSVMIVTFDNKKVMITGDINVSAESVIMNYYTAEYLKCDVMQGPHHGLNYVYRLFNAVNPDIFFFPTNRVQMEGWAHIKNLIEFVTAGKPYYLCGEQYVGLRVENGSFNVFYTRPVVGSKYTGWEWIV